MRVHPKLLTFAVAMAMGSWIVGEAGAQCVSLTSGGSKYQQDFDALENAPDSAEYNLSIPGWFSQARDVNRYTVSAGSASAGDVYSYGASGSTERALGSVASNAWFPIFGACFTNDTGVSITGIDITYTGEQWRLGTTTDRPDQLSFTYSTDATSLTTGTWTPVVALDFVAPTREGVVGPLNGNASENRRSRSSSINVSIPSEATFWIRWSDLNASDADDGLAVDDFSLTPLLRALSVNDVSQTEGDAGTRSFTFAVSLSAPAGPGGVTFDIATASNTASAGSDYVASSLTAQTIPAGSSTYPFHVIVNGDVDPEFDETFFVNVTNVTGASVADGQGVGSILDDDTTRIHDVQGSGASSPIVGATVTVRGIVTAVTDRGFFVQEPDAMADADPATSEGVFVFTDSAPPVAAAVGNLVLVRATVAEFVPGTDPQRPSVTRLESPTVTQLSSGNLLPAAVSLSAGFPHPAGAYDQLERLEGMRVQVPSLTVVGPTQGNINEANATATSSGVFHGVVTGVSRPFREPGIEAPDAPEAGSIPPIPRFDANPERIAVDSDGQVGASWLDVGVGAVVSGLVGVLHYGERAYTLLPDPAAAPGVSGGPMGAPVTVPGSSEFTVASYNLQRFYDTVNDPAVGEPVLTPTAFDARLNKASLAVRNFLRFPDVIAVQEVENLDTLQALAFRINADAVAASQADPRYVAYLVEGNDPVGLDVGLLVKTAEVAAGIPRVEVVEVVQELEGTLQANPDSSVAVVHDRPPLRLGAVVHHASGASFPVTVIAVDLQEMDDADSLAPGANGWPTVGASVRARRLAQAEDLANLVQARQTADPTEHIVVVGDFNAYPFNDGLVDVVDTLSGTPSPDNETVVPGDGVDLVNPDLVNLVTSLAETERYSYAGDGHAAALDHVLTNAALVAGTAARRVEYARVNADFAEIARNDSTTALRLSDRDPVVAFFAVPGFVSADLSVSMVDAPDPVVPGANVTYTVTVANDGPDLAPSASWIDTLPAGTTFVSLSAPAGWACTTPAVGGSGTVNCSIASLAVGTAAFTLVVQTDPAIAAGTVISNTVTVSSAAADLDPGNDAATATVLVSSAATTVTITGSAPNPSVLGQAVTVSFAVAVNAPSAGTPTGTVTVSDGSANCSASVAEGSCILTPDSVGLKSLVATYSGAAGLPAAPARRSPTR